VSGAVSSGGAIRNYSAAEKSTFSIKPPENTNENRPFRQQSLDFRVPVSVREPSAEYKNECSDEREPNTDSTANTVEEAPVAQESPSGENEDKKRLPDIFSDIRVLGQAFSTFILLQHGSDSMLVIDQHAAHERIMYEKLKKKYEAGEKLSQVLLTPIPVELTRMELEILQSERDFFEKLGFIYESFGNNSIILRSVPFSIHESEVIDTFREVMDYISSSGRRDFSIIADDTLYSIACKSAVKANRRLDEAEIRNVLAGLSALDNPYTCPHGRPVIINITRQELEKMFKRIL
jgi:DNA mismatch repair protein MutL